MENVVQFLCLKNILLFIEYKITDAAPILFSGSDLQNKENTKWFSGQNLRYLSR